MDDGYFGAWSGKTIQYISDNVGSSPEHRPNVILLAAGTKDMHPKGSTSTEGNDPKQASERLGKLIDKMIKTCPDATILVAMIINTCNDDQSPRTKEFQKLIPEVVKSRKGDWETRACRRLYVVLVLNERSPRLHPPDEQRIPKGSIKDPEGSDPSRDDGAGGANGGIDKNIPAPNWGKSPIQVTSKKTVANTIDWATGGQKRSASCPDNPQWKGAGQIAIGSIGHNGDWKYKKNWVEQGEVASGLGWENRYVRLHDMNGDGKADPNNGEIRCWLNNLPKPWSPVGNNNSIIGSGAGPSKTVYLADMNADGMNGYMVVNEKDGSVRICWNYGPDDKWENRWKFVDGGQIASGVPHANLKTLRFPDINGDGRADYVYIGQGGSLKYHMNIGSPGGQDVLFEAMGGIATGAVSDISKLVFADMNGDRRDGMTLLFTPDPRFMFYCDYRARDYLIWGNDGGLTGFLNKPTKREGVPIYVNQGPAKTIANGIHKKPSEIRLAYMDGDGKDDYVFIGDHGALFVWYNRGSAEDNIRRDGIHFADVDGDGLDDYVRHDPKSGSPIVINKGTNSADPLGWGWSPLNAGNPITSGAAPTSQVVEGDIDSDGYDDYLDLDPQTGALKAYLNKGEDKGTERYGWRFELIGEIAPGLGPGHRVRIADIDGDGRDDYIYLKDNGDTTIYRNIYSADNKGNKYEPLPDADASGIGQSLGEIQLVDINGDGKADYVWIRKLDGRVHVWFNDYPKKPTWRDGGEVAEGYGTSGANIKYAKLTTSGRADYVAIDPEQGSIAAWLNGFANPDVNLDTPDPSKNEEMCYNSGQTSSYGKIEAAAESFCRNLGDDKKGPVFSDFYKEAKKTPPGNYHFIIAFEVFEGCKWTFSHDEWR
ncbi:unnamed protein product, partial [Clonostachys chloroleuca]